jgi:hypothetical protein
MDFLKIIQTDGRVKMGVLIALRWTPPEKCANRNTMLPPAVRVTTGIYYSTDPDGERESFAVRTEKD